MALQFVTTNGVQGALRSLSDEGFLGDLRERAGLLIGRVHPLDWRRITPDYCFWERGKREARLPFWFDIKGLPARFRGRREIEMPMTRPISVAIGNDDGGLDSMAWTEERIVRGAFYYAVTPDRRREPLDLAACLLRACSVEQAKRELRFRRGGVWQFAIGPRTAFLEDSKTVNIIFSET